MATLAASAPSDVSAPVGLILLGGGLDGSDRGISFGALREQQRSALFRAASRDVSIGIFHRQMWIFETMFLPLFFI